MLQTHCICLNIRQEVFPHSWYEKWEDCLIITQVKHILCRYVQKIADCEVGGLSYVWVNIIHLQKKWSHSLLGQILLDIVVLPGMLTMTWLYFIEGLSSEHLLLSLTKQVNNCLICICELSGSIKSILGYPDWPAVVFFPFVWANFRVLFFDVACLLSP